MQVRKRDGVLVGPVGSIASNVIWATSLRQRYRGVRGRDALGRDEALVITPCRQVHTRGVGYPLDAVFCDRDLHVLHVETLRPGSVSTRVRRADCCIELLGGRATECEVVPGAQLAFEPTASDA